MGRSFRLLWAAYAVSAYGSGLGFGALPLIAVLVLDASPAQVSALAAVGPAVGALIAVPLGPWVEFRRKRPVMIAMDLIRFGALLTIPFHLTFAHLLINDAHVLLNYDYPEYTGGPAGVPTGVTIHLEVDDADRWWNRAVEAGATVRVPLDNQFWGARYGQIVDPFGHIWSIGGPMT